MQITHIRLGFRDQFAIQFEHDAQDAMRGRMRRPHVQNHLLALHVLKLVNRQRVARGGIGNFNVLNSGHENYYSGFLTRGSRLTASPLLGKVTNGPPSIGEISVKATSGTLVGLPASGKSFRNGKYG